MKLKPTPQPSRIAAQILVRTATGDKLVALQHDGWRLGKLLLVPPAIIKAELERRNAAMGTGYYDRPWPIYP